MDTLTQLIGQDGGVELLKKALEKERIPSAYLFVGPSGVGRSMAAFGLTELLFYKGVETIQHSLIKKKLLNGNHPDFLWIQPTYLDKGKLYNPKEAAEAGLKRKALPQIRISQIREVTKFLQRQPIEASLQIVIIEDAHLMAENAANALLKTLEEPESATLILIAPSIDSLLPTLISRCQCIPFYRLSLDHLKQILEVNGYSEILNYSELLAIAQGSPGQAIASFENFQSLSEDLISRLKQPPKSPLDALNLALHLTQELDTFVQLWLIDYLQDYYWNTFYQPFIINIFEETRIYLKKYVQPRLVWECCFLNIYKNFAN